MFAILRHENRWGTTHRSLAESFRAGRRARRDLAVLLAATLESDETFRWLNALRAEYSDDRFLDVPRRPTVLQALLLRLPNTRKRCAPVLLGRGPVWFPGG